MFCPGGNSVVSKPIRGDCSPGDRILGLEKEVTLLTERETTSMESVIRTSD